MKWMTPEQIFYNVYKGKPNIMTPNIVGYYDLGEYVAELSWGRGFDGHRRYGVTVLTRSGERTTLSKGGLTFAQAHRYMDDITRGGVG